MKLLLSRRPIVMRNYVIHLLYFGRRWSTLLFMCLLGICGSYFGLRPNNRANNKDSAAALTHVGHPLLIDLHSSARSDSHLPSAGDQLARPQDHLQQKQNCCQNTRSIDFLFFSVAGETFADVI